jgi:hypothetical protein
MKKISWMKIAAIAGVLLTLFLAAGCGGGGSGSSSADNSNDSTGGDDENGGNDDNGGNDQGGTTENAIIIDHNCTTLSTIPSEWIAGAKADLHIAYGCTSHGSQILEGLEGLYAWKGSPYTYDLDSSLNLVAGSIDLRDKYNFPVFPGAYDLGNPDRVAWAASTRTYLNAHPEINVVMWSWCGQVSSATEANITSYLSLMNDLEADYPDVHFVYMTGHLDGTGLTGNLNIRNEQIRDYCRDNDKILYDFADIESYDPDGNEFLSRGADDGCAYDGGNWATAWQNSHTEDVDWFDCAPAHTQALNGNLKAYAAWWLFARLAGWDGQ